MAIISQLDDVAYKSLQVKGYSNAALTEEKTFNLFYSSEVIKCSSADQPDSNYLGFESWINRKLTKYQNSDCEWCAVLYIIPCSISALESEVWVTGKKGISGGWDMVLGTGNNIAVLQDCDFFDNENIPWPTQTDLNPEGLTFTEGFNVMETYNFDGTNYTNPFFCIKPGYLDVSTSTIKNVGWRSFSTYAGYAQPFILFKKMLVTINQWQPIQSDIKNNAIKITPTYNTGNAESSQGLAMCIIGVEKRNVSSS